MEFQENVGHMAENMGIGELHADLWSLVRFWDIMRIKQKFHDSKIMAKEKRGNTEKGPIHMGRKS